MPHITLGYNAVVWWATGVDLGFARGRRMEAGVGHFFVGE